MKKATVYPDGSVCYLRKYLSNGPQTLKQFECAKFTVNDMKFTVFADELQLEGTGQRKTLEMMAKEIHRLGIDLREAHRQIALLKKAGGAV